jgi:hypothetical protein
MLAGCGNGAREGNFGSSLERIGKEGWKTGRLENTVEFWQRRMVDWANRYGASGLRCVFPFVIL